MTELGLTDFIARMKSDQAFQSEVLAAEVGEDRLTFVNGAGYDLCAQDPVDATSELGDEELDRVQGGSFNSVVVFDPAGGGGPLEGC
jgi:predicted ribosomally synthesized peptide with nif11-like leader